MVVITAFDDHVWGGFLTKIYHFFKIKVTFYTRGDSFLRS